jgi:lambda family phage portal protein
MIGWLRKLLGANRRKPARFVRVPFSVRANYDAAMTTDENRRHWANADYLSANALNSPDVRSTLRSRARYEVANNCYAFGIVMTKANHIVGTGPRLQVRFESKLLAEQIETAFRRWYDRVGLAEKVWTATVAKIQDGESFLIAVTNPFIATDGVQLDYRLVECDQVTTPYWSPTPEQPVDGVVFDAYGNVQAYHVLKEHPGDVMLMANRFDYDVVPAEQVIHIYTKYRPGQARGIPEITPALPLFAQLRRYTLAVLSAAETAADFAGILYTDAPPGGEAIEAEEWIPVELERRMLVTMPAGWKMEQLHVEQPSTTYGDFKRQLLSEIARCLNMPYNVAACDSSNHNFSSGRLDMSSYFRSIAIEQANLRRTVLDRIFYTWLREYLLANALPLTLENGIETAWFWDTMPAIDPVKEAQAIEIRLRTGTTTLAQEYAAQGLDWEEALRQRAREVELMRELGLPVTTDAGSKDSPSPDISEGKPEGLDDEEVPANV